MDKKMTKQIKDDLLAKKEELEKELASFASKSKKDQNDYISNFPEYGDESDENAQEVSQYSTNIEAERILEKTLKDINDTIKKIDKGEYGICKYCGKEISPKRLKIRPFSSACIKCKLTLQSRK
ncbi:MAG: TraR/DksA C4-type zinc finger protein [bacterium]